MTSEERKSLILERKAHIDIRQGIAALAKRIDKILKGKQSTYRNGYRIDRLVIQHNALGGFTVSKDGTKWDFLFASTNPSRSFDARQCREMENIINVLEGK